MIVDPVTARWTEALFGLAQRQNALDAVKSDVAQLAAEVASQGVREWLMTGKGTIDERKAKLAPLLDKFHPITANFVRLLFDRSRQEVLIGMPEAFRRRLMEQEGSVEGRVIAAHPLSEADVAGLAESLGKRLGKRVLLQSEVDSSLIGGVRVMVGSRMLDYSVQGRLDDLRRKLLDAPLPAAAASA